MQEVKHGLDVMAISTAGGAILGLLPPLAAGLSIVWITLQIIDRNARVKREKLERLRKEQQLLAKLKEEE